jgi:hypothetical protein
VVAVAECQEFLARELGAIVGDDRIRDPKPEDNINEEQNSLLRLDLADGSSLDPLGELVDCHQQVSVAPGHLLQRANEVQSPHGEQSCDGDGLQSVNQEVCLPGVELAALAGLHNISGVGDRSGLVKALSKRVAHEGTRRGVVTADASVDVTNQLLTLGNGDASLQNARGTTLVQLVVDQYEELGPPSDVPCLSTIRG